MKKIIYLSLIPVLFFLGCKNKNEKFPNNIDKNAYTHKERSYSNTSNYAEESVYYTDSKQSFSITMFEEQPDYPKMDDVKLNLIFSDSNMSNIIWDHIGINIESINVYSQANKESEFKTVNDYYYASMYKIPGNEDWLYFYGHGFICIYDLPADTTEQENKILSRYPIFKKHGPLLEINYNNKTIKLWSHFGGEVGSYRISVEDYYENYDELLILNMYYESSDYSIYSLRLEDYTDYSGAMPYFNNSRNTVISVIDEEQRFGKIILAIYSINNGVYTKIMEKDLLRDGYYYIKNKRWINDDEFKIEYDEGAYILIKRNGANFDLTYK